MDERVTDVICANDTRTNCPIALDGISCDGYKKDTLYGVYSHFHQDHMGSVSDCIANYDVLIAHPITFEGINALKPGMKYREQWVTQDYDTAYKFPDGFIRLLKANHIPGSSQVYVESAGKTMVYSGDFSYPDVQIREADYLVIDSSHGDPWHDGRTDRRSVKNRMFEHVEERLELHDQAVIQVSSGTLQEIVRHFEIGYGRRMREDIAFVMEEKQRAVLHKIYREESDRFRDVIEYDSPEYYDLLRNDGKKCVIFATSLEILDEQLRNFYRIMVDRFKFTGESIPVIPFEGGCRFNLAAHASIQGIYQYVEAVNPKHVVTDYSRSGYAKQLAKLIGQKFPNIKAEHRPPH